MRFDFAAEDDRDLLVRQCEAALAARSDGDARQDGVESLRISTPISSKDSVIRWPATLEFSTSGISLTHRGNHQQFRWRDVREIRIIRSRPDRYDFQRLEIDVGDEQLRLLEDARARWSGGDSATLERMLRNRLPSEKLLDVSLTGRPTSQREFEFRQRRLAESSREWRFLEWFTFAFYCAITLLLLYLAGQWLQRLLVQPPPLSRIFVENLATAFFVDMMLVPMSPILLLYLQVASRYKRESDDLAAWTRRFHNPVTATCRHK